MIIGFTGSREGLSPRQKDTLFTLLWNLGRQNEFHHGDCIGADKMAHDIATCVGMKTWAHPPTDPKKRAFCKVDVILPEKPYLDRNRDIVEHCQFLIATPLTREEILHSGTWSTIRYAKKVLRECVIIDP